MSLPTPADLGLYLGITDINTDRAALLLQYASDLCLSVVDPLPDTANSVVIAVAGRAYTNVSSAHSLGLGSAQLSYGAPGANMGVGGLYLSRSDIANLRRLAGRSGAFTIDPTPADAGTGLPVWSTNTTYLEEIPGIEGPR